MFCYRKFREFSYNKIKECRHRKYVDIPFLVCKNIKVDEELKRNFYIKETINSRWSVRELQRQIGSLLYERLLLLLSGNKEKALELAEKGYELKESKDLVKDPFVLEFLDIKENKDYLESDLEKNILEHLKEFLLEFK